MTDKQTRPGISPNKLAVPAIIILLLGTIYCLSSANGKYLLPFYVVLANLYIGFFVLLQDWDSPLNRTFFFFTFFLTSWTFCLSIFQVTGLFIWGRLTYAFSSFIPPALYSFIVIFPTREEKNKVFTGVLYFLGVVFCGLAFTDLILKSVQTFSWGYTFELGSLYACWAIYFAGIFIFNFVKLYLKYRKSTGNSKSQIVYFFTGAFLNAFIAIAVAIILPLLGFSRLYYLAPPSTLMLIGFVAYAIVKHHLMNVSVIISRTVAEIMAVVFHGAIYLSLVWLYRAYVSTQIDLIFLLWTTVYGVVVGQTHQELRTFFQTTSDKLFLRGKYDYYKSLAEASAKVGQKLSLPAILGILYDTFTNVIEISDPRIFLQDNFTEAEKGSHSYLVYDKKTFQPLKSGEEIKFDDPLVDKLIATRQPLIESHNPKKELIVPCIVENRLIGFFVLGRKLSEDAYTDEDIRLIEILANQAAMALDHTRSYEKIRVDLEAAEHQLERSQRLASIGTLTAGVTHEIRNPLTVIRAETERLANQDRDIDYLKNYSGLVLKHIERIEGIVQRMLGMAREKEKQEAEIDIGELIETVLPLMRFATLKVKKDIFPLPLIIKGDPAAIQEVFVNLFQNAIEATPPNGQIIIKTYLENHRPTVEISDTGKGIPPEIQEKIFDPFFSTRHEGVGLGLSIVYKIIREHGGDIKVTSHPGDGTTFKITF